MDVMVRMGLLAAGMLVALHAQAQIFKCVDANGKTVYLQSPCPAGASSSVIGRKPRAAPDTPGTDATKSKDAAAKDGKAAAKAPPTPEEAFQKRQKEREEAEKKAADEAAALKRKQEDCRRAREQVAQYDMGGRISRANEKGERVFLDDDQIASEKAKAQAAAAEACK